MSLKELILYQIVPYFNDFAEKKETSLKHCDGKEDSAGYQHFPLTTIFQMIANMNSKKL